MYLGIEHKKLAPIVNKSSLPVFSSYMSFDKIAPKQSFIKKNF